MEPVPHTSHCYCNEFEIARPHSGASGRGASSAAVAQMIVTTLSSSWFGSLALVGSAGRRSRRMAWDRGRAGKLESRKTAYDAPIGRRSAVKKMKIAMRYSVVAWGLLGIPFIIVSQSPKPWAIRCSHLPSPSPANRRGTGGRGQTAGRNRPSPRLGRQRKIAALKPVAPALRRHRPQLQDLKKRAKAREPWLRTGRIRRSRWME